MNLTKVCLILSMVFAVGFVCAEDIEQTILQSAAEKVYSDMREKIPEGDAVSLAKPEGNIHVRFNRLLAEKITSDGVYRLIDRENLAKLFEENLTQQDRVFDNENAPQLGVFTPAKWLILGTIDVSSRNRRLKKFWQAGIDVTIDRIETGEVLLHSRFSIFRKEQPPVWLFMVNLGLTLLALIFANRATKGYYAGWLALGFLLENTVFIIWQFVL